MKGQIKGTAPRFTPEQAKGLNQNMGGAKKTQEKPKTVKKGK